MTIREEIKKVGQLLDGKLMTFDHSSYDLKEDIPHLFLEGKRQDVNSVEIYDDGRMMNVYTDDGVYGLGFYEEDEVTFEMIDKELEEMGMDTLLRDIYYNHSRSWEIGDYEDDFLTLN
jgi:hypothetical protein